MEAIRPRSIKLKETRYAPKAELPPMKNLRPEGARAEEGQEAPTREEGRQEEQKAAESDQEGGPELMGPGTE